MRNFVIWKRTPKIAIMIFWPVFLVLVQIYNSHSEVLTGKELPCNLKWATASLSDLNIPKDIVKTEETGVNNQYIIRGNFVNETDYGLGRFDNSEDVKTIFLPFFGVKDENSTVNSTFEFLVNPNRCYTKLADKTPCPHEKELLVSLQGDLEEVVGLYLNEGKWYPAHVNTLEGAAYVAFGEGADETYEFESYSVLLAFAKEIEMELVDFEFSNDPVFGDRPDFAGMDEIHNDGPGEVSVTLTHEKEVTETYSITMKTTWMTTRTNTLRVTYKSGSTTVHQTIVTGDTTTNTTEVTHSTTETNIFTVSQRVVVPPYTSIQACSVIKLSDNKVMDFNATVCYSARGVDPDKLIEFLKKEDNITAVNHNGDVRGTNLVKGKLEASMVLNTEFVVVPYDSEFQECMVPMMRSKSRKHLIR